MPTFDPLVFDFGTFDANFPTPVLFRIVVPLEMRKVTPGSAVTIFGYIKNVDTTQGHSYLMNPETSVEIDIYKPDTTALVTLADMTNQATGLYIYQLQLATNAPSGMYGGKIKAVNGDKTAISPIVKLFEVI
jgi:hypothetical protein